MSVSLLSADQALGRSLTTEIVLRSVLIPTRLLVLSIAACLFTAIALQTHASLTEGEPGPHASQYSDAAG